MILYWTSTNAPAAVDCSTAGNLPPTTCYQQRPAPSPTSCMMRRVARQPPTLVPRGSGELEHQTKPTFHLAHCRLTILSYREAGQQGSAGKHVRGMRCVARLVVTAFLRQGVPLWRPGALLCILTVSNSPPTSVSLREAASGAAELFIVGSRTATNCTNAASLLSHATSGAQFMTADAFYYQFRW